MYGKKTTLKEGRKVRICLIKKSKSKYLTMRSDFVFVQRVINMVRNGAISSTPTHHLILFYFMIFIFWVNLMAKLVTSQWRNGHFQNKIKFGGQKIKHLKLVVVTLPCRAGLDHLEH